MRAAANQGREEYVELELARRKRPTAESSTMPGQSAATESQRYGAHTALHTSTQPRPESRPQPTMQGKLQEVDLGEEARARNIAMTERARLRLKGHHIDEDEDDPARAKRYG